MMQRGSLSRAKWCSQKGRRLEALTQESVGKGRQDGRWGGHIYTTKSFNKRAKRQQPWLSPINPSLSQQTQQPCQGPDLHRHS